MSIIGVFENMSTKEREDPRLVAFNLLRQMVGYTACLLPFVLALGAYLIGKCTIQESISHYYYTVLGDVLVGATCAISVFLIVYRGYRDSMDNSTTNLAGFLAIGVAIFPTTANQDACCTLIEFSKLSLY